MRVSPWRLFAVWFTVGWQSFGGGTSTLALIRRAFVDERRWITDEEVVRDFALCQIAPGINLLALTILIGNRLGGPIGIVTSLAGLMLPSCVVTIAIAASYARFQHFPMVRRLLAGVIPGTIGLGLLTGGQLLGSLLKDSRRGDLFVAVVIVVAAGAVVTLTNVPVVALLIGGGAIGAVWQTYRTPLPQPLSPPGKGEERGVSAITDDAGLTSGTTDVDVEARLK